MTNIAAVILKNSINHKKVIVNQSKLFRLNQAIHLIMDSNNLPEFIQQCQKAIKELMKCDMTVFYIVDKEKRIVWTYTSEDKEDKKTVA